VTRPWPNPADTPLDRRALIARAYRDALLKADREMCEKLDAFVAEFGEDSWLIDQPDNGEELVSRNEVARRAGVRPDTVSQWDHRKLITRYPGGYRWSEVDDMLASRRRRRAQLDL
jgi:hypothetical protein